MKDEIKSAVDFLTNIIRSGDDVNEAQTRQFNANLTNLLSDRYQDHWFPEKPFKGSGYRCMRLNHNMDPLILQAGNMCGLNQSFLESSLPPELTIWVDPRDVSFRIGENGSVGVLYQTTKDSQVQENPSQSTSTHMVQQSSDNTFHQMNRNFNNTIMSCKDQFMNVLPSISREAAHYHQFAGFISS
ncbi:protein BTG2-like [Mercenaria mercenaria]|uniref:protein BTG2-like n=1 Tax=Mercenaria mercenaria TaxID=6596 RepID=UPI001E1DF8DF|nr:protein BTG2-like [Mercenaria mercenaria]